MSPRRPLVAGNWKMNETIAQARALVRGVLAQQLPHDVDIVVAPPFTALPAVAAELAGTPVALGAQTMHERDAGPFTGEISPVMLQELGVAYAILGHSERRAFCGETDAGVNAKVHAALAHEIVPIVAVGETREEHVAEQTLSRVVDQTRRAFAGVAPERAARCVVAYEPIWAIGTGLSDEPANADAVMGHIRASVPGLREARILYGGSVNSDNAAGFFAQPNIDGGLIGGASLNPTAFAAIVQCASIRASAGPSPR